MFSLYTVHMTSDHSCCVCVCVCVRVISAELRPELWVKAVQELPPEVMKFSLNAYHMCEDREGMLGKASTASEIGVLINAGYEHCMGMGPWPLPYSAQSTG